MRPSEIGRWERGEVAPPPTRVRALARVLGVDQATMLSWIADAGSPGSDDGDAVDIVIDLAPADPFVRITDRSVRIDLVPSSSRPVASVTPLRPPPVAAVFPAPGSLESDRHVYSAGAGFSREDHQRVRTSARSVGTLMALVALGIALAWAFQQLGSGFGDLVDLFGGGGEVPGG